MISKGDDFPIHQLPAPVAEVGTERNFYDRYFFNGYSEDGSIFFGAAFCVYPNLNIKDASFILVLDGIQHNFRYSDVLNHERMETEVGSFKIEILEPLEKLKILIDDEDKEISANLTSSVVNLCSVLATRPTACAVDRNFVFLTMMLTVS